MVSEAAAIRLSTQIICDAISRRRFRPQIITNSIDKTLTTCEENGRNMKNQRAELNYVRSWILSSDPKIHTNVDVTVFRLCRALPVTKKTKKKLLTTIKSFSSENNKKWRSIPKLECISCDCSTDIRRHIDKLVSIIETTKPLS